MHYIKYIWFALVGVMLGTSCSLRGTILLPIAIILSIIYLFYILLSIAGIMTKQYRQFGKNGILYCGIIFLFLFISVNYHQYKANKLIRQEIYRSCAEKTHPKIVRYFSKRYKPYIKECGILYQSEDALDELFIPKEQLLEITNDPAFLQVKKAATFKNSSGKKAKGNTGETQPKQ